jgi:hypothetical protein
MLNDPESSYRYIQENARRLTEERAATAAVRATHSRSGLLAQFLRRLADRIDPTGEQRRLIDSDQ